jgi:hypothetical protein
MKNLDLNAYGVSEMSQQEMLTVDGGGLFSNILNAIRGIFAAIVNIISEAFSTITGQTVE